MEKLEVFFVVVVLAFLGLFLYLLAYGNVIGYTTPAACAIFPEVETFKPSVEEIEPGVYRVKVVAAQYYFLPAEIKLQNPKRVIFEILSKDVVHGFAIEGTNVNLMVFPRYVAIFVWEVPQDMKGTFLIYCNEYCGTGHQTMYGHLIIER